MFSLHRFHSSGAFWIALLRISSVVGLPCNLYVFGSDSPGRSIPHQNRVIEPQLPIHRTDARGIVMYNRAVIETSIVFEGYRRIKGFGRQSVLVLLFTTVLVITNFFVVPNITIPAPFVATLFSIMQLRIYNVPYSCSTPPPVLITEEPVDASPLTI